MKLKGRRQSSNIQENPSVLGLYLRDTVKAYYNEGHMRRQRPRGKILMGVTTKEGMESVGRDAKMKTAQRKARRSTGVNIGTNR